jgi:hypothetical protein
MTTKAQLLKEADSIESSAKDNLPAWVMLGQSSKYSEAMDKAAKLRKAADMGVAMRREFMRNNSL